MKVRESKSIKNQQVREAMNHIEKARHILRSSRKVTKAGFVVTNRDALDDVDQELIFADRLLWDMRNGY